MKTFIKKVQRRGSKSTMPEKVSPMLCTLVKEPPNDPDYLYEIKWDGYRIISYVNGDKVRLDSRGAKNYTAKYPPIVSALKDLNHKVVLDGEIIVFDKEGLPDFNAVQNYNGHGTPISYYVFDVLWMDGYNLKNLPFTERKQILKVVLGSNKILRLSESFDDGVRLFDQMKERGLEGIIAKRKASPYKEGDRGNAWLKIPTRIRQEFVIGGWAESDKSRSFRSLLFGAYTSGKFEWIGRSGGGYKEKDMPGILNNLKKIEQKKSPFINEVLDTKGAVMHWVKPQLVANFEFAAWTPSGRIRKPATFLGFRSDKKAKNVVREIPIAIDVIEKDNKQVKKPNKKSKIVAVKGSNRKGKEK